MTTALSRNMAVPQQPGGADWHRRVETWRDYPNPEDLGNPALAEPSLSKRCR